MNELEIEKIVQEVSSNTNFWVAVVGIIGALVGSLLTILGSIVVEWYKGKINRKLDKYKQSILRKMLIEETFKWRKISTLSAVIGCNEEETKKHLIFIKARGSEKGDGNWGLISRNPLNKIKRTPT